MSLSSAVAERVDGVFADMDVPQHPGAALLVVDQNEIVYLRCYGLADLETQRTIIVLMNYQATAGPRVRVEQVAEILFRDGA